ncbi:MAG TPA: ribosome silencing factor [Candidatus Aminicenantes bacterium]|nr:ribosome silencing factor [Acidobacteriota bacterium]HOY99205.1 ribosome silencing factor [Candidatus Aminicenantes bacterium]HPH43220.1 ribosome silencing factor [Candidatus Aminicenantes bacterium]
MLPPALKAAIEASLNKKAEDVVVLDLRAAVTFTEFFLIMTGLNVRQTGALAEAIEHDLKAMNLRPIGMEGAARGEWILMDYGWFIVHIFSPASRDYYALERLWSDAPSLMV